MEALIRWVHPTRGLVLPNDFIPLAEECGLITKIGLMVIEQTCAQLAQWQAQQLPCLPVSINVSLKQIEKEMSERDLVVDIAPDLPLSRTQHEMIAAVVSITNDCFY